MVFGDASLEPDALALHRRDIGMTLLTALDLPWVAGGLQRDGAHVREPVDDLLRGLLHAQRLRWVRVSGQGEARVEAALDAVAPLRRGRGQPRTGLFTRLHQRNASPAGRSWVCQECDVPECEHASMARLRS